MTDGKPKPRWVPKPLPPLAPGEVRLLTGGNPQIAKGDGPAPVAAYLAAMPGWKRPVGERIDALVTGVCPDALRAVRWNAPFWGRAGQGWILSLSCVTRYVKVAFFKGTALHPMPPVASKKDEIRYLHIHEDEALDDAQLRDWLQQAFDLPGAKLF